MPSSQEMQQCRRQNVRSEEEILKRHLLERRRLPQLLKNERKTRMMIFKESLRIGQVSTTPEQDREKIKQVFARILILVIKWIWLLLTSFGYRSSFPTLLLDNVQLKASKNDSFQYL